MAHNMAGAAAQTSNPSSVPNGFRPAFFAPSTSPRSLFNPSLSAKESRDTYTSPSELLAFQSPRVSEQQQALVAGLAAQTLFSRMTGAFIDAFAGTAEEKKSGRMSGDKVASVLEGRATLQVVMNPQVDVGSLGMQMGGLVLGEKTPCSFESVCKRWTARKGGGEAGVAVGLGFALTCRTTSSFVLCRSLSLSLFAHRHSLAIPPSPLIQPPSPFASGLA